MTIAQINRAHRGTYVMGTKEGIFIAPLKGGAVQVTTERAQAERWSYADVISIKLEYHKHVTGLPLKWEKI